MLGRFARKRMMPLTAALWATCRLMFADKAHGESGSEVLYMDEEVNFLLLDQVSSELKEGDRVCLYHQSLVAPYCQASFRWISRKPLIFLSADMMSRFQVGARVEIKKIYVSERKIDGSGYTDASSFGRDFLAKKQNDERVGQIRAEQSDQPKIPKGSAPRLQTESANIEGGDFPEIFIPKIRKSKPRPKKDTGETADTIAAIKKALKEKGTNSFQFLPVRAELEPKAAEPSDEVKAEDEIPPSPLHQAIDFTVFQTQPLLPVASFQSLRYRTISSDSLSRNSLWLRSQAELKAVQGAGFSLNLVQSLSRIVSFGWRYHVYEKAASKTTYDEIEPRLEAQTSTRISAQAVHGEIGWRFTPWDWMLFDLSPGVDLFYSDMWFRALKVDSSSGRSETLGYARSSFFFVAPRWHSAARLQYRGWGFALGGIISIPLASFKRSFDGSAVPSDRLTYNEDPGVDLQRSLTHKIRPIGVEAYLGLSYQPQRN